MLCGQSAVADEFLCHLRAWCLDPGSLRRPHPQCLTKCHKPRPEPRMSILGEENIMRSVGSLAPLTPSVSQGGTQCWRGWPAEGRWAACWGRSASLALGQLGGDPFQGGFQQPGGWLTGLGGQGSSAPRVGKPLSVISPCLPLRGPCAPHCRELHLDKPLWAKWRPEHHHPLVDGETEARCLPSGGGRI